MLILVACPECGVAAEVTDRFTLTSTDGPVEHMALRCAASHHFRMPVEMLQAQGPGTPACTGAGACPTRTNSVRSRTL